MSAKARLVIIGRKSEFALDLARTVVPANMSSGPTPLVQCPPCDDTKAGVAIQPMNDDGTCGAVQVLFTAKSENKPGGLHILEFGSSADAIAWAKANGPLLLGKTMYLHEQGSGGA